MNTRTTVLLASMIVLALAGSAQAQTPEIAPCAYSFGSGAFVWCVSESGTLTRLTSPAGAEHIRVGNVNEGYVVCAANVLPYYDAGTSSFGWGDPVVVPDPVVADPVVTEPVAAETVATDPVAADPIAAAPIAAELPAAEPAAAALVAAEPPATEPAAPAPIVAEPVAAAPIAAKLAAADPGDGDPSADPITGGAITIERTSIDGRFTLRQVLKANDGERAITITMTLTNNLEDITGVQLLRSADLDVDNTFNGDVFDKSADAAWARQARSVTLSALDWNHAHQTRVSNNLAPRTCLPTSFFAVPAQNTDLAASIRYDVGTLAAGDSKTLRFRYRVQ